MGPGRNVELQQCGRFEGRSHRLAARWRRQGVWLPNKETPMSDTHDDDQTDPDAGTIAGLREAARQGAATIKENEKLRRELLFAKAGVDTSTELGEMLFATWAGDDIEELKAKAGRLTVLQAGNAEADAAAAAAATARATEDAQRTAMQGAMGAGGSPGGTTSQEGPDPRTTALEEFQRDIRAGKSDEQARADAMGKVLGAGLINRDPRVLFDQEAHNAAAAEHDRFANTPR